MGALDRWESNSSRRLSNKIILCIRHITGRLEKKQVDWKKKGTLNTLKSDLYVYKHNGGSKDIIFYSKFLHVNPKQSNR